MAARKFGKRGQSLVEFALVLPLLLFLMMGIFDFGRAFVAYAMASNSLRSSLRNAEIFGYSEAQISYTDCDRIRTMVQQVFFVGEANIDIQYEKTSGPDAGTKYDDCNTEGATMDAAKIDNGDLLEITVHNTISLVTPLISQMFPVLTFDFYGQRTIVNDIPLTTRASGDVDYDGLLDSWEIANFCPELALAAEDDPLRAQCLADHTALDDPDLDNCNNGCEETRQIDPEDPNSDYDVADPSTDDQLNDGAEVYIYHTDPLKPDTDNDGLLDGIEIDGVTVTIDGTDYTYITDPLNSDTDGDGLSDGSEVNGITVGGVTYYADPTKLDSDGDGISDYDEIYLYSTNPLQPDTDYDGLSDDTELNVTYTLPNSWDSDGDSLSDGAEVNGTGGYITDPLNVDDDGDGLWDGDEVHAANISTLPTDPHDTDSDDDGLSDGLEAHGIVVSGATYYTNPNSKDTDGDTYTDYDEVYLYGTDPTNAASVPPPIGTDSDGDGLGDAWEISYFDDLSQPAAGDPDSDGCDNICEQAHHTDPRAGSGMDSDGDGLDDGYEVYISTTSPTLVDSDFDGLNDGTEVSYGTDPHLSDSDADGLSDGSEVNGNTVNDKVYISDPLSKNSDADGLEDGTEINVYHTDPMNPDTDGDHLTDSDEALLYHTVPTRADTDGDSLNDDVELLVGGTGTDPLKADTDADGLSDGAEVNGTDDNGNNPNHYTSSPNLLDTDGDGLGDGAELNTWHTNPNSQQSDGDALTDGDEVNIYHTDPALADTDGDGLNDDIEIGTTYTDPLKSDTDGDGLSDSEEVNGVVGCDGVTIIRTDPLNPDTDGDGSSDGSEVHDCPPTLTLSDITANRVDGYAVFTVTLINPPADTTVTVNFTTLDSTATSSGGQGNIDFESTNGKLTFQPGTTTQTVTIVLHSGKKNEAGEQFILALAGATNADIGRSQGLCTLIP